MKWDVTIRKKMGSAAHGFALDVAFASDAARLVLVRSVGRRQDPDVEGRRRPAATRRRPHRVRRQADVRQRRARRRAGARAWPRLPVPGIRAVPAPHRPAEHRLRTRQGTAQSASPRRRCGDRALARRARDQGLERPISRSAFRRPAATHRARARARRGAARAASRRALRRARPAAARQAARRAGASCSRASRCRSS